MICTRNAVITHWQSEPKCEPVPEGYIRVGWFICFPDVRTLSFEEKTLLRPIMEKHPDYLQHEIGCEGAIQ